MTNTVNISKLSAWYEKLNFVADLIGGWLAHRRVIMHFYYAPFLLLKIIYDEILLSLNYFY